jgi:hypothetical protein
MQLAPLALKRRGHLQLAEEIEILFEITRQEKILPNSLACLAAHLIAQFFIVNQFYDALGGFSNARRLHAHGKMTAREALR